MIWATNSTRLMRGRRWVRDLVTEQRSEHETYAFRSGRRADIARRRPRVLGGSITKVFRVKHLPAAVAAVGSWRRRPDSNRSTGLCRPLPNRSATPPELPSLLGTSSWSYPDGRDE